MAVSIYQLGYKKLSQIVFEWQAADRASLLALFIVIEIALHWLWCLFVWLGQDAFNTYVDMQLLYFMWFGVSLMGLFFWLMVGHLSHIKNDDQRLNRWQIVLISVYSLYIGAVILVMGHSSLFSGVSLAGGAMLGMMLAKRSYIWKAFLGQVLLILLIITLPYLGVNLPNLRQLTLSSTLIDSQSYVIYSEMISIENTLASSIFENGTLSWSNIDEPRRSSAFFWRSTHMYLALPKAIFMVYVFRTLLLILDDSKKEIVKHASQDELTKLMNRRYGLAQMQQTLMAITADQDYSLILLDLDLFKEVNDNYGHEVGDQVLREVAEVLSTTLTEDIIVSRYGGEEFLIALPNTSHDQARDIAEQLRFDIAQQVMQSDDEFSFKVTASLGFYTLTYAELSRIKQQYASTTPATPTLKLNKLQLIKSRGSIQFISKTPALQLVQLPQDICQRLISTADKALYKSKELGRNQVVSANELLVKGIITEPRYGT
jgi:diguanylate cyclase (GGDEF)-like protein